MTVHDRIDAARGDAVDRNAGWRELFCERLREGDDAALGGRVGRLAGGPDPAPHGRYIDDVARLLLQHAGDDRPACEKDRREIDIKNPVPVTVGEILDQTDDGDARIVHKGVHRGYGLFAGRFNKPFHEAFVRNVAEHGDDFAHPTAF